MKIVAVVLALLAPLLIASCSSGVQDGSISKSAQSLNQQSKASLGVGIPALRFLSDGGHGDFFLKDGLTRNGSWADLKELEEAGHVVVRVFPTADGEFVEILLTPKGAAVKEALRGP